MKAVVSSAANISDSTAEAQFVTNVVAVHHDHFFNFRLDMDMDGQNNSYVIKQLQRAYNTNGTKPRQSYWTVTKYNSSEKFASGVFTNQATGDQTLLNW
ncbi:hypothetical protein KFL_001920220 [Klebsormidium nitens]|uniref:Amine oxidase n=1 Tax=Klebsormidium nitens TaxID=105231 RepID=A0A1Y1I5T8_KLENI|nr:hypothetical protein KFL_001920220 [Klebsormidium nitens]|eukprot:GAQ84521.1 hypothetical protein KFL_001920220 [Klebsormidium nitens]